MIVIYRPKGSGKTSLLCDLVKNDEKGIMVCFSAVEAERIVKDGLLPKEKVIPFGLLIGNYIHGKDVNLYIDNIDLILQRQYGNVKAVSATDE